MQIDMTEFEGGIVARDGFTRQSLASLLREVTVAANGHSPDNVFLSDEDYATLRKDFKPAESQPVDVETQKYLDSLPAKKKKALTIAGIMVGTSSLCSIGEGIVSGRHITNVLLSNIGGASVNP